jgi:hypothetical protein
MRTAEEMTQWGRENPFPENPTPDQALRWHRAALDYEFGPPWDVAELQPDQDSPGLWIGFETAADREQAMKLFRVAGQGGKVP